MTATPPGELLRVERCGPIARFSLNRPLKYNALSADLNLALTAACRSLDPSVAVVVLAGEGKHFCCGSDLKDLYNVSRGEAERVLRLELEACLALAALPQLTVSILHGKCYGGGAFLPLYTDLRIGRPGVEFAFPEVALGWIPPFGIERLLAGVPRTFALEMLLSGRVCGDLEALEKGWLHRLLAPQEEQPFLERLAQIPARTRIDTLRLAGRRDLHEIAAGDEKAMSAFLDHFDTEHARNQIASFVEKRRN